LALTLGVYDLVDFCLCLQCDASYMTGDTNQREWSGAGNIVRGHNMCYRSARV